jgi:DNA-binding LacI/PurR family transcriptional regulator
VLSLPFSLSDRADRPLRPEPPAHRVTRGRLDGYGVTEGREVGGNDRAHGEAAAGALLDAPEPPTALLCMSDELAIGALAAARARGLVVPRDLSVVGWDDTPEALRADPPLTTIRQSLRDQGRRVAELAAAGATGEQLEPQPWELVVRESTASFPPPVR